MLHTIALIAQEAVEAEEKNPILPDAAELIFGVLAAIALRIKVPTPRPSSLWLVRSQPSTLGSDVPLSVVNIGRGGESL